MKKLIVALMAALTMLFGSVQPKNIVNAEEYEKNILISCESKEIDINDIPENREVELNVSIENAPVFFALGVLIKYDMRLNLDEYVSCYLIDENDASIYQIASIFTEGRDGYAEVRIDSRKGILKKFEGDFFKIIIKIPSDAKAGDEYILDFKLRDDIDHFYFLPNTNEIYHEELFAEPIDGSIKIIGAPVESTVANDVTESSEETNKTEPEISNEIEVSITEAPKESSQDNSTSVAESTTVVSMHLTEQTSITSVPETTLTTIPVASSSTESTTSEENTSQNSTSVTKNPEHDEAYKRSYIILVALVAVILAVSAALIVNRQRRSK